MGEIVIYADGHYATIVRTEKIIVRNAKFIHGFITAQPYRSFQHFRVQLHTGGEVISIINAHAVSSDRKNLTDERRTMFFKVFHEASGDDSCIWGGDFNTNVIKAIWR